MTRRLFRLLVLATPRDFRREFGEELGRVADEQWARERGSAGVLGSMRFWGRQSLAVLRAAALLRRREHEVTGGVTMDGLIQDLVQAARGLVRRPGFTAVTVLTLGLGIGSTTAIFSAVHTVLLRPLPYAAVEHVVAVYQNDVTTGERGDGVSASNIRDFRDRAVLFDAIAVAEPWSLDLRVDGRAESLRTWAVSRGFFDAIGADAMLGRTFTDADYDEGASALVVIGHRAWANRFAADPSILGRALMLDGQALTVVGVMPPDFRFPDEGELWIPRTTQPWDDGARAADFMTGVARLADGVSVQQARTEAEQIAATLRESYPQVNADMGLELVPLREHLLGDVRTPLVVIMTAVVFVLLIACANVAGLMLARGAQRERDYALRGALGAGTGRLISHVSAESLLLAAAGGLLGVALTYGGVAVIQALGPDHLPRIDQLRVDRSVLGFAVAAAMFSAIVAGVAPSLRLSRPDLRDALGDGSRGSTGGRAQARARGRLVVAQVAAAVVLLFGSGLLLRSFDALLDKELGFDPRGRLAVQIFAYDYESTGHRQGFLEEAVAHIEALPGVTGVGITTDLPGATDGTIAIIDTTVPFTIQDRAIPPAGQEPMTALVMVSDGYFDVLDIDVVTGRDFDDADDPDGRPVAIVNETLARRHFGDADPLSQVITIQLGAEPRPREIVGVVRDIRPLGHASEPRPEAFVPLAQASSGSLTFVVRTSADAGTLTLPVMEAIWDVNPAQSIWGSAPMEDLLADWLKERRFNLFLLTAFSAVALVLAAIGLYGLVSFSVERRLAELGIRRALGGQAGDLVGMVLGEGARLAATGLAIGLAAAVYLSRFMQGMLFEIEPTDPMTFALLSIIVLAIAALATLLPALRAMRVDPVEALRSE